MVGGLGTSSLLAFGAEEPRIRLVQDASQRPIAIEAVGLSDRALAGLTGPNVEQVDFTRRMAVIVALEQADRLPLVTGSYRVEGNSLRFTPRYPLQAGLTYRVMLHWHDVTDTNPSVPGHVEAEIVVPDEVEQESVAAVQQVYPSSRQLPENHLRFYLHFATAMARGDAYRHLELRDDRNEIVPEAFLELGEELWDRSGERFTLLLDPGRVKHALEPREELGPVLEAGRSYTLVVKAGWRDASGRPLASDYRRQFHVGPAVHQAINPGDWKISEIRSGTLEPLTIRFPAPLDRALALRAITIREGDGEIIPGEATLGEGERVWRWTPTAPWRGTSFRLHVDPVLEDTAGNNLIAAFEVDPGTLPAEGRPRGTALTLPVSVSRVFRN